MDLVARLLGRFARSLSIRTFPVIVTISFVLIAAAPALAGTLRGIVVDPSDRPVEGADVRVIGPLGVRTAVTDGDGRFEVPDLPPAAYHVLATLPGLEAPARRVVLDGDATDVRIVLSVRRVAESVVVSASQVEVPLSAAPASVTVVDRAELESRQIDTLGATLSIVPGMIVSHNGGPGSLTSLFPRGGDSDFTLVLVDGIRLNTFGGTIDLSQLALAGAERIEIVRGPQSALYGSDAIGGVVHVIGRQDGGPLVDGLIEGGSRATTRYAAGSGGRHRQWSWYGNAERLTSEGDTRTAPASGERVTNDDWRLVQAGASLGFDPSPASRIRTTARVLESERGAPGPYGSDPAGLFPGVDTFARGRNNQVQFGASADHPWAGPLGDRVRQRWSFAWSDLDSDFRSRFGDFVSESGLETRRLSARSQTDILLTSSSSVSAGVDLQFERARSTFVTGERGQEVPIERRVAGYFGELRHDIGRSMAVTAGIRVEDIRRSALEGDPFAFTPRPAFDDDRRVSVNPRISWIWALTDGTGTSATRIHASAGTGIRPPDVFEIAFTDNPALKPERSRSFEAGVRHRIEPLGATLQLTGFHNTYDDLIVATGQLLGGSNRYRTDNISNARTRGLELSADWEVAAGLRARAAYTLLDTEILAVDGATAAPPPFKPGDPLIRRPRHTGALLLQYSGPRFDLFAETTARGRTLDIEPNFGAFGGLFENAGFAVVDLGGTVRASRRIAVFGRVMNLLDRRYEEVLGYPAPERRGMAGVRVAFGD
ncbi:MAG TPA: TonB-dependent receptor [Vicinamibacterales bacterium]|nr:TonB-dependent receptor [Vicinamibacterales bacterium]